MSFFDKFYKDDWYWRSSSGLQGDFIFDNCAKIVHDEDKSGWSLNLCIKCGGLLIKHDRWPDFMNDSTCVNSWVTRIINRTLNQIRHLIRRLIGVAISEMLPYHYQHRMVRDAYIAFYTAAILHKLSFLINVVKPAWYVYTPHFYCWRKYLITKKEVYLNLYRLMNRSSDKEWRQRLDWLRETAIEWTL